MIEIHRIELWLMQADFLKDEETEEWNRYVKGHTDGTFFHLLGWRDVLSDMGLPTYFLVARDAQQIVGALPLAHQKSFLFGNHLVSLPYCVYGGILADNDDIKQLLLERATSLGTELGVGDVELRQQRELPGDLLQKDLYVTFRRDLPSQDEEIMQAIPRKQRAMVRKGIKAELTSEITQDLDEFYAIYAESVRNLGTPVFGKRYFKSLSRHFAGQSDILLVRNPAGKAVAGVMSFYHNKTVLPYYGGSLTEARALKANDFMYWELMRHAAAKGMQSFDFGRSKEGTGPYSFKKNWGFTPEPLPYSHVLIKADKIPEVNPNNPKYTKFISMWKSLPLPLANLVGPILSRNLG